VRSLRVVALALLCSALAACGAATTQSATPNAPGALRASSVSPLFFLFDASIPPVAIDEIPVTGGTPVAQIRNGLTGPAGAIVDANGTLYVANYTGTQFQILEYPFGALSPASAVTIGVGYPGGMTVGPKGELYVFNVGGPLVMYAPGSTTPAYATYNGVCKVAGEPIAQVAVDPFDTLYAMSVCKKGTVIREYDNGSPLVARTIHLAAPPIGLTADQNGTLYVTYFDTKRNLRLGISEYRRGTTMPSLAFDFGPTPKHASGGSGPVIDETTGRLYATFGVCIAISSGPWHCEGDIYGFRPGSKKPDVTITAPHLHVMTAPVFDAAGNLYTEFVSPVSPLDSIWRYSASGTRQARLVRNRGLQLITVWPNADSSSVTRDASVPGGFVAACQSTPMSQSSPRSFLANERKAISVSVLTMPLSAAMCSVTKSLSCSCSFTRAMATRSNGPATE
jgi:hypothetical protein